MPRKSPTQGPCTVACHSNSAQKENCLCYSRCMPSKWILDESVSLSDFSRHKRYKTLIKCKYPFPEVMAFPVTFEHKNCAKNWTRRRVFNIWHARLLFTWKHVCPQPRRRYSYMIAQQMLVKSNPDANNIKINICIHLRAFTFSLSLFWSYRALINDGRNTPYHYSFLWLHMAIVCEIICNF